MEETMMQSNMEGEAESAPMEETAQSDQTDTAIQDGEAENAEAAVEETGEASQPLSVKFNGAQRELSTKEAVEYAQKGLNYDKIHERLQAYEKNTAMQKAFSIVKEMSDRYGITPEQYLEGIEQQREQDELDEIAEEKGLAPRQAREVLKAQQENDRLYEENKFNREFQELFTQNPDLRPGDIPEDAVYYRSRYGMPLKDAYRLTAGYEKLEAENASLKRRLAIQEESQNNKGLSVGSVRGASKQLPRTDRIGKMSIAEYEKYRDAIWAELERKSKK